MPEIEVLASEKTQGFIECMGDLNKTQMILCKILELLAIITDIEIMRSLAEFDFEDDDDESDDLVA